jgi:glycosyltransferase involved in cell wall biosynthesis
MIQPRISLILAAYDAAEYIGRWFECNVFAQTFPPIEVVMVNDGSTDQTEAIVKQYATKLEALGIHFYYVYQQNQGVGCAVNKALKMFTGDYLALIDADDFLAPDSLEKRVNFLELHPEYGFVRSDGSIFDYDNLEVPIGRLSNYNPNRFNDRIFKDLMLEKTYCTPGCYMLRVSALLKVNPTRSIYPAREGQNWQILLPMAWNYRCGFMDEPLFNYVIYPNSVSHKAKTFNDILAHLDSGDDIMRNVLSNIEGLDWPNYKQIVDCKNARKKLQLAFDFQKYNLAVKSVSRLRESNSLRKTDFLLMYGARWPILYWIVGLLRKMRSVSMKMRHSYQ